MFPARLMLNEYDRNVIRKPAVRAAAGHHRGIAPRAAFTLLEVMIVLSIAVGFLALSWPRMQGLVSKHELQEAALSVKAACAEARDRAVRSGHPVMLQYEHGGGQFRVVSSADPELATEAAASYELPTGIEFDRQRSVPDPGRMQRAEIDDPETITIGGAATEEPAEIETILFHPEGRSSSATVRLTSVAAGRTVELTVRGLTGGVIIGPVTNLAQRQTELPAAAGLPADTIDELP